MSLTAIKYHQGSLELLDQRLLPFETVYLPVPDALTAWAHIKDMVVRGAPAIGVTGALTMAVVLRRSKAGGKDFTSLAEAVAFVGETMDYLVTSRPTAVNLADSATKLKAVAAAAAAAPGATPLSVSQAVISAAEKWMEDDIAANKALGAYGAEAMLAAAAQRGRGVCGRLRVLTHCNTGSLATAAYGTALGVIRALHSQGKLEHAFCTETRPYNQGARLTAFELVHGGMPATLICDSAAAALMASGQVDAVVVGADRVVANGDTANKIGTHMLSIVAAHHGIPFFIAAPTTTLDANLPDGSHIVIEQRSSEEVTHFRGQRVVADNIGVWNPAFDIAPGGLIEGIITERGVVPKARAAGGSGQGAAHQVQQFMAAHGLWSPPASNGQHPAEPAGSSGGGLATPEGFQALTPEAVKQYVLQRPQLSRLVGPSDSTGSWSVREVGDGNINFVYIVEGPSGAVCIKQALPYVRCIGESWPLTQDRMRIEVEALAEEARHCPLHVPRLYLVDTRLALVAMQYLAPPFLVLRRGLIQGATYPPLADHISDFLASTLFRTSLLALDSTTFRQQAAKYCNPAMCKLTEQVIFMDPYVIAPNNRWTTPQLDADVEALRQDPAAKVAITGLKAKFCNSAEALLHGDLHTGSLMVTQDATYVIDPEFAFYGPIAFDVAKMVANLLLAYFAADGQEAQQGQSREAQRQWLLATVQSMWEQFAEKFLALWNAEGIKGDLYPGSLLGPSAPAGPAALAHLQRDFMQQLQIDTLAFSGAFIIRRIVGVAHVADLDCITDPDVRSRCERRALQFGRRLLVQPQAFGTIQQLVKDAAAARDN